MARNGIAIVGASVASAVVTNIIFFVYDAVNGSGTDSNLLPIILATWIAFASIANLVASLTLGLLWRRVAEANQWRTVWHYFLPGMLAGFALTFAPINGFALFAGQQQLVAQWFATYLPLYVYGAMLGGLTALFAWLIRRPDRDPTNSPTAN